MDRFHSIDPTKTYNFKAPTLVTSASHKITAKCTGSRGDVFVVKTSKPVENL